MALHPSRHRSSLALVVVVLALALAACSTTKITPGGSDQPGASQSAQPSVAKVHSNLKRGAKGVDIAKKLKLRVTKGTFDQVQVTGPRGDTVQGKLSKDKSHWVSKGVFAADTRYKVVTTAVDSEGRRKNFESKFRTRKLRLDEQTYPSFVPTEGQTVGVGMPVIIRFDVPVTDRASIERHLQVISKPAQVGAFHWISGQEVHWRPKRYWQPGTDVTVKANIGGVPAGNGIYGQMDRQTSFHVGPSMVSKVDINTDQMRVFRNGKLLRTIPITTGEQPDFTTRSGVKVIVEKYRYKNMNSETIGIDPNSANGYNLSDVEYAMRVTYSGEFLHAAPWSVASQGSSNVSHGCTGMSTSNAGWLYNLSHVGDVVEYTGSNKYMTLTNGFGDWNMSFKEYKAGSAL
jgi:lipoprotein-anchoring transpeptidase ErfK/SrfK